MLQPKIKPHLILEPNNFFLYIQSGDGKIMEDVGIQSTLEGSFSAVSQPIFVSKYSGILLGFHLDSIFCTIPKSNISNIFWVFSSLFEKFQYI